MKKFLLIAFFTLATLLPVTAFSARSVFAVDTLNYVCSHGASNSSVCQGDDANNSPGQSPILHVLDDAIRILSVIIGIAAVIVIIVQGMRIVLSNGDPQTFENARNTILYACIGIVIAILAQVLVTFVLQRINA